MSTANLDESEAICIIVGGSRSFDDYEFLVRKMNRLTRKFTRPIIVVSGTARGADTLGERWAYSQPLTRVVAVKKFHPDWEKHKKAAGPIRNQEMVKYADRAVFFWDGESSGTRDCIERAKREPGMKVKVYILRKVSHGTKRPNSSQVHKTGEGRGRPRPPVQKVGKRHKPRSKVARKGVRCRHCLQKAAKDGPVRRVRS